MELAQCWSFSWSKRLINGCKNEKHLGLTFECLQLALWLYGCIAPSATFHSLVYLTSTCLQCWKTSLLLMLVRSLLASEIFSYFPPRGVNLILSLAVCSYKPIQSLLPRSFHGSSGGLLNDLENVPCLSAKLLRMVWMFP